MTTELHEQKAIERLLEKIEKRLESIDKKNSQKDSHVTVLQLIALLAGLTGAGATLGTAVGPGIGTAVGASIGLALGITIAIALEVHYRKENRKAHAEILSHTNADINDNTEDINNLLQKQPTSRVTYKKESHASLLTRIGINKHKKKEQTEDIDWSTLTQEHQSVSLRK